MSDPFSIASGSAGLVSLGLTLCKGLSEYISAVRSHGEDVRNLERKLNTIEMFLQAVDAALKDLNQYKGLIRPTMSSGLWKLHWATPMMGWRDSKGIWRNAQERVSRTSLTSSPATGPSNLRSVGKTALYYFRKGTLKELEQIIDGFQDPLGHSLDLLTARLLTSQSHNYQRITIDMSSFATQLQGLQSSVTRIEDRLSDTSKTITALSENLSTVQENWQLTTKRVQEMAMSLQSLLPKLLSFFVVIVIPLLHGFFLSMGGAFQDIQRSILSLSTDTILFEDMLGRPFRLQFSLVSEWRVFEAFLTARFEDIPGEASVTSGRYHLLLGSNNMVLPKSRKGWANSISPGAKVFMSLQVDIYIPKRCPRCDTALNIGESRAEIKCTTSGCWTAFQEARDSNSKIRQEDAQTYPSDVAENLDDSKAVELKLFSRVHFP
ncbi:Helo-like-N domain-containing protein [Fusarium sp. LHS14.1]|nr:Helo-like-N domain-containing protein [Fusarium sp. LHS14.1]